MIPILILSFPSFPAEGISASGAAGRPFGVAATFSKDGSAGLSNPAPSPLISIVSGGIGAAAPLMLLAKDFALLTWLLPVLFPVQSRVIFVGTPLQELPFCNISPLRAGV